MRCSFALLLIFFLSFGAGFRAIADDRQSHYVSSPGGHLELRTLPSSTVGRSVAALPNGTKLEVLGREYDGWWYVRVLETSKEGWVYKGVGSILDSDCCAGGSHTSTDPIIKPTTGSGAVKMQQRGGTYVVPVLLNDAIQLDFVVDSGAADVSIPSDVVSTLFRTHTIDKSDIVGEKNYVLADGSKGSSIQFRLKSLKVGNSVVRNVIASSVPSQGILLLGQSLLGRFQSWSIDNTKHELSLNSCCQEAPVLTRAAMPAPADIAALSPQKIAVPLPPTRRSNSDKQLRESSRKFVISLYRAMSSPNERAFTVLANVYAGTVNYFGTDMPRDKVVDLEKKFLQRWPVRSYKPRDRGIAISCDGSSLVCFVNGVLQFEGRNSESNQRFSKDTTFQYRLQFSSAEDGTPKITLENGSVLKKTATTLSPLADIMAFFR